MAMQFQIILVGISETTNPPKPTASIKQEQTLSCNNSQFPVGQ